MADAEEFFCLNGQNAVKKWLEGGHAWNDWVAKHPAADIDFSGVDFSEFEDVSFVKFSFPTGEKIFPNVKFGDGDTSFTLADFSSGDVRFDFTKFGVGDVSFIAATFKDGDAVFWHVDFGAGDTNFSQSLFRNGKVIFD